MADWFLDDGHFLDEDSIVVSDMTFEASLGPFSFSGVYSNYENIMEFEVTMEVVQSVALDIKDMVPEKFFNYNNGQILVDYLDEAAIQIGSWLTKVRDIVKLLSPNTTTSTTYLRHLGALIGVTFPPEDLTSAAEMRKNLEYAVQWYKLKGTYYSIQIMGIINQLSLSIYDMYTNDYSTFYMTEWFVGTSEDQNPTGYDSTYYKSPHFGLQIDLNKLYVVDSTNYLWTEGKLDNLISKVEETRPVHTVPHYIIKLNPVTDEFGTAYTVLASIATKVFTTWQIATKYFDQTGADAWNMDDGTNFDQSATAFIQSIDAWTMGTGNYPSNLSDPGFVIENPAITGSIDIDNITIGEEKITFEFIVPKATVQTGLSSLGLYRSAGVSVGESLVLASTFPKIDLDGTVEMRVVVEVYKKDLS